MTNAKPAPKPDHEAILATADAQAQSPFFSLLPAELRQLIYIETWRDPAGDGTLRQHITRRRPIESGNDTNSSRSSGLAHAACITDPAALDLRYFKFQRADPGSLEKAAWLQRLKTDWSLHWACEEALIDRTAVARELSARDARKQKHATPFLPVLTTCKRMYLEALPSLYQNTTFIFNDTAEAAEFLAMYTPSPSSPSSSPITLRSIEMYMRASNLLTELYYPYAEMAAPGVDSSEGPSPIYVGAGAGRLSMANNPWARACESLARQPDLRSLYVWFDTRDLRAWWKRVSETNLFARLREVHVKDRRRFILALPTLPEHTAAEWMPFGLPPHHFLVGDELEGAPFVVVRGERPNNWRVHMGDRFGDMFLRA
ncbi:hypothetical protein QBC47DRAFT_390262 [Echria macrotheca]|uniref:DUF7730 domain-containing protein n=1 Tax=Echria macrotheca TaxID=438768 RepID=A0AAJ0B5Y9_9PEZI|nr:hypothetical protein QBC47DRAFT_390262 [Echria macrotheca]